MEPNATGQAPQPTGQVPEQQNPTPPAAPAAPANPPAPDAGEGEEEFDKERALTTIRKLREIEKAAKQKEKDLAALQAELKKRKDAELSEQERQAARLKELEEQVAQAANLQAAHKAERTRYEVMLAAGKMRVDPELAGRLIDPAAVEYDTAGKPSNVEALIKDLVKRWPHLQSSAAPANVNAADRGAGKATPWKDDLEKKEFAARYGVDIRYLP